MAVFGHRLCCRGKAQYFLRYTQVLLGFAALCGMLIGKGVAEASTTAEQKTSVVKLERTLDAMGTTYAVDVYGTELGKMQAAVEQAFDEVERLDQMLSNYIPTSELSEVNRRASKEYVPVSPEFFDLLQNCLRYSRESGGSFDLTVGPLMRVWGFYKGTGHLPHRAEVRYALSQIGYQYVELDSVKHAVHFRKSGIELDPGGIGKGYAVDRMVNILRKNGITSALVSGGGSSIYGIGHPPDDKGWPIEIREPKNADRVAATVYLKDSSVSTSGNYEKFFRAEGKLYSHIMDPRTGYPSQGTLAVSVVAPRTIDGEVWAKPYYILGKEWTIKHKPKDFRVLFCEDKPGGACAWLP